VAVFRLRRAGGGSGLRGGDTLRVGSPSGTLVPGAGSGALVLDAVATGSIRPAASGTATLVLGATSTGLLWANGAAAVGDVTDAATLRLGAHATGSVVTPVEPPPAGSTVAPIKRVSITMPAPVLDAEGRPT
jgi:hypothetical protein